MPSALLTNSRSASTGSPGFHGGVEYMLHFVTRESATAERIDFLRWLGLVSGEQLDPE
jgi:hypothetical protein